MQRQKEIIARRIAQIAKMRAYLIYSNRRMRAERYCVEKLGVAVAASDGK